MPPPPPRCLSSVYVRCCWICLQIFLGFYFYCRTAGKEGSKERKAFLLLLALFLVNAKQLAMVAEAGTLPTEYGFVNSGATTVYLGSKGYSGTLPTEMGYMTKMASYFCSNIPTELAALSTSLNLSTYPSAASTYWNIAASGPISNSGPRPRADPRKHG